MAAVKVCHKRECSTILSKYNGGNFCSLHRKGPPRRIAWELSGEVVLRDDEWVRKLRLIEHPPREIQSWKPQMMSEAFIKGLDWQTHPQDKKAYEDGSWLG